MTFTVTENCIRCKYTDCVEVCPVDCFRVGEMMLVIDPEECIDCGVCEPECPAGAIVADTAEGAGYWVALNRRLAAEWPGIDTRIDPPADADEWNGRPDKLALLEAATPVAATSAVTETAA